MNDFDLDQKGITYSKFASRAGLFILPKLSTAAGLFCSAFCVQQEFGNKIGMTKFTV